MVLCFMFLGSMIIFRGLYFWYKKFRRMCTVGCPSKLINLIHYLLAILHVKGRHMAFGFIYQILAPHPLVSKLKLYKSNVSPTRFLFFIYYDKERLSTYIILSFAYLDIINAYKMAARYTIIWEHVSQELATYISQI